MTYQPLVLHCIVKYKVIYIYTLYIRIRLYIHVTAKSVGNLMYLKVTERVIRHRIACYLSAWA
jgi:hypothetical protein